MVLLLFYFISWVIWRYSIRSSDRRFISVLRAHASTSRTQFFGGLFLFAAAREFFRSASQLFIISYNQFGRLFFYLALPRVISPFCLCSFFPFPFPPVSDFPKIIFAVASVSSTYSKPSHSVQPQYNPCSLNKTLNPILLQDRKASAK